MLLRVGGAVVLSTVSGLLLGARRRLPWDMVVFNCGNYTVAAVAAATAFHALGLSLELAELPRLLGAAVLAGMTHYLHTFVVAVAIATERRSPFLAAWSEHFAWLWPQYGVLGVLALFLALAQQQFGAAGAAVFAIPPLMMLHVARQSINRTAALAREAGRAGALEEQSLLKSRFISVASHEMRTPLTGIAGYVELLLADTAPDDPRHAMLETVDRCTRQMVGLVDAMLDASRLEIGQLSISQLEVDLAALTAGVLDEFSATATKHRLMVDIPSGLRVWADPDRLHQILANLVGNAIKYSPSGGDVRVTAREVDGTRTEIEVADQGLGIPAEELEHIFDPYQRASTVAHRRVQGSGLGLYIVRSLVELHGGTVRVESTPSVGSTFVVTLPTRRVGEPAG
jgi:signal transduction histidine kinase